MKKGYIIGCLLAVLLAVALFVWNADRKDKEDDPKWEGFEVAFHGVQKTSDNPWGCTAGIITDDENRYLFLMPDTSADICNLAEKDSFSLQCRIHPSVAEYSDGVRISAQILDKENVVLAERSYEILPKSGWVALDLPLKEFPGADSVSLSCSRGEDDKGDWVIVRKRYPSNFAKDHFVKSATYFAEEWPINFWNSEMNGLESDMEKIKGDDIGVIRKKRFA